jgi:hypothetical protein
MFWMAARGLTQSQALFHFGTGRCGEPNGFDRLKKKQRKEQTPRNKEGKKEEGGGKR